MDPVAIKPSSEAGLGRNVPLSFLYAIFMDFSMTAPIWVLYLRDERGFSMTQIAFLEVPLFLLIVFAEVPTGAIADRYGRRISLVLSSSILAVSMFIYGIAEDYLLILISNLSWALAFTFRSGADTALLYDSLKALAREGEFQRIISRLWAVRSGAALGGLLLGAPIAAATSYSFAIVLTAGVVAVSMVVALLMSEARADASAAVDPVGRRDYFGMIRASVREVFDKSVLRALFLFGAVVSVAAAAPLYLLQQPWLAAHHVATSNLGLLQAAAHGAALVSALAAPALLSRLGLSAALATLPLGLFLSCGLLATLDHVSAGIAFLGVASVAGLLEPLLSDEVNRRIESARRATTLSVKQMFSNVLMAMLWPLVGSSVDRVGLHPVFMAYALGALVVGGLSLRTFLRAGAESPRAA